MRPDVSHAVGDARKRLLSDTPSADVAHTAPISDIANFDEQHAHLHEWPEPNIERGED